jgi:dipeptidyl aminopeptidase/acylaminoacyl peptidase
VSPPPPADLVRDLLQTRSTILADVEPRAREAPRDTERLLLRSDLPGTMQLYELVHGERHQLTALPEPVAGARYVGGPGARRAVLEIDQGGNERYGLYLLDIAAAQSKPVQRIEALVALTDDLRYGHRLAGVSPDGLLIAYLSNRATEVDFDLWLCEIAEGRHRRCWASGSFCQPGSGFSPDGRYVSVLRPGNRPLDDDLVLIDVSSGEGHIVLAHPDEAALVGAPAWLADTSMLAATNAGRELSAIIHLHPGTGTVTPVAGTGQRGDAEVYASDDGTTVLIVENEGGHTVMRIRDARALHDAGQEVSLPARGVVSDHVVGHPRLSRGGERVVFTLTTPRMPGDVWVHERATTHTRRLTTSPAPVGPERLVEPASESVASFDGEAVPVFVYRPARAADPPPVVVMVHGGPESQAMLTFNPIVQALALSGYAVVVPNVRGSTGYGRRYAALDDKRLRLDSVRDLAAVHGFLAPAGLDPDRAALWGGSYGGYMVLAGLAFQPELWAAGVDIVGISDLVGFLKNTSDYRRVFREHEYGSLEHDRDFLASASPLRRAGQIRAPLFVIHGRNDPRVPVSEAEQLVANLRGREIECELAIYEDEGHGLARLPNRLDAYPRAIAFLDRVLRR